jgi:hypothetical protein
MGLKRKYCDVESQSSKTLHDQTGRPYFTGADPTRKQRQHMPMRFRVPVGQWPVYTIPDASGRLGRRKFFVDWEVNSLNGNIFAPSWVSSKDCYLLSHNAEQ